MNKLRRKLLKFSILKFLVLFIPTQSFAFNIKSKKKTNYKKKEFKGFVWYLDNRDK